MVGSVVQFSSVLFIFQVLAALEDDEEEAPTHHIFADEDAELWG